MRRSHKALLVLAGISAFIFSGAAVWQELTVGFGNPYNPCGDAAWILMFLKQWQPSGSLTFHDVHPTRGWTPKAHVAETNPPCHTNGRGLRGTSEYVFQPDKYVILAVGDSFTFGAEAADQDAWPCVLESLDSRFQVINLGVSGYGLDQMYITLRETMGEYKPALVLFAPIAEDLHRSLLSFRGYRKPRFVLDGEKRLQLTNVPIGEPGETLAGLRERFGRFFVRRRLDELEKGFLPTLNNGKYDQELKDLNSKIVLEADHCTRATGADFLLVHLATVGDASQTVAVLDDIAQSNGIDYLSTRAAFEKANRPWSYAHYQRYEAVIVAKAVFDRIGTVPSWKAFARH